MRASEPGRILDGTASSFRGERQIESEKAGGRGP